ncbi:MAG: hypothetical protein CMJ83_09290 [Planctomycetes bacterium]|nr:hypothetical protein [Planctomycetota bacterium]
MIEASPTIPSFQLSRTLEEARRRSPVFGALARDIPYEAKGVLFSEILFLAAAVGDFRPPQIVESGRARGQSTYLLGLVFPDTAIVSIERYRGTDDARVAEARCRPLARCELLYGDSNVELLRQVGEGDVVVIDGPKGWHAIQLALRLLRDSSPAAVFVHDCYQGLPERTFLDRYVPGAFFSDDPQLEELANDLDAPCFATARTQGFESWEPHFFDDRQQASYGPTYACLPHVAGAKYATILARLSASKTMSRLGRSLRRRFGGARS